MTRVPELLLPAGTASKLQMALDYGADAVYAGAAGLSMRPDVAALSVAELAAGLELCHARGRRLYVAINSLYFDRDLPPLERWLVETAALPFDAVIVSDLGALRLVRERRPELAVHISTQAAVANSAAARFLADAGANRVILARECSIADGQRIAREGGLEVEVFVHGAMCVAISGRCLLSAHLTGRSGSTGDCKHSCRWEWQLVEQKRPGEALPIFEEGGETFLLGSTDLCLIEYIPELVQSGVAALKVEGRMKSEHYVAAVARVYRAALDAWATSGPAFCTDPAWLEELESVSHRPYGKGFAFGYPENNPRSLQTHNRPVSQAKVIAYLARDPGAAPETASDDAIALSVKNPFAPGDKLEWIGPGFVGGELTVASIVDEEGAALKRTISATTVWVDFHKPVELPPQAIIRRRVDHDS
ncbi:MAG: peptidase U32 [Proteobacteria bacterium]|nr:MAG: peptidase U32 [Pseudomonadota bacterium]